MKPIAIITQTYNRLNFTMECLSSIFARTRYPYKLIVIDNASTDGTREYLKFLHNKSLIDKLILNETNMGIGHPKNQGYTSIDKECDERYFILTDSDIVFPMTKNDCWLTHLIKLMEEQSKTLAMISVDLDPINGTHDLDWWFKGKRQHFVVGSKLREFAEISTGFHGSLIKRKDWEEYGGAWISETSTYGRVDEHFRNWVYRNRKGKIGVWKGENLGDGNVIPRYGVHLGWSDPTLFYDYHIFKKQEREKVNQEWNIRGIK